MLSFKLRSTVLAIALLSPSACAPGVSSSACPPLVVYSRADMHRAADELQQLPANSAIERMLADYAVLRDQVRACR